MKYINAPVCVCSKCGALPTSETNNVPLIKLEFDASEKAAKDKSKSGVKKQNLAMFSVKFKKTEAVEGEEPNKANAQEKSLRTNVMRMRRGNRKWRSNLLDAPLCR